jgi:hypothetical protein
MMIFSSCEEIGRAIELLDEHEDSESVRESPISESENIVYMRFHESHIETIRSTYHKDNTLMLLHFLTEPDTHSFCISKTFPEDITKDDKTVWIFF